MSVKLMLYIIMVPICVWVISALNLDRFFKKNKQTQIVIFYVILSLGLAYLAVNFIYDFYDVSRILY